MKKIIKKIIRSAANRCGYSVTRIVPPYTAPVIPDLPDSELYQPVYSPWLGAKPFRNYYQIAAPRTLVSADRCYVLYVLLQQALHLEGDIWECGVYKGGTAAMAAAILKDRHSSKRLFLFDTFEGMPETDPNRDWHKRGDFSDTSMEAVSSFVGFENQCVIRKGFIPDTFRGLESAQIAFAHIDVDIYKSILDSLSFIWPRLANGGFIVFDDYGAPTCPGARVAVDEFFAGKSSIPLCLPTGQAVVFKSRLN
jgi:O-methyltransferase